jgi:hypothetical protein
LDSALAFVGYPVTYCREAGAGVWPKVAARIIKFIAALPTDKLRWQ